MSFGAVGAYGAAGVQDSLEQLLKQRIAERLYQDKMRQQEIENSINAQEMSQRTRQLDQNEQFRRDQQSALEDDRKQNRARQLVSELSPNQSIDPATAGVLRSTNRGALVKENPPPAGQGFLMSGPEFQPGSQPGLVFTGSAGQLGQIADDDRARQTFEANERFRSNQMERQAGQDTETTQHHRAMERIGLMNAGSSAQARDLAGQLQELRIQTERDKLDRAREDRAKTEDNAKNATQTALDLADRLEKHPGLGMASGYISSRFSEFSQPATDANAIRDQLVATLTLPNLGALKGPMSDKDVVFVKQLATRLSNSRMSDAETRKALAEAKTFLQYKMSQGGGTNGGGAAERRPIPGIPGGIAELRDGKWIRVQ